MDLASPCTHDGGKLCFTFELDATGSRVVVTDYTAEASLYTVTTEGVSAPVIDGTAESREHGLAGNDVAVSSDGTTAFMIAQVPSAVALDIGVFKVDIASKTYTRLDK